MKTMKFLAVAFVALMAASCGGSKGGDTSSEDIENTDSSAYMSEYDDSSYDAAESIADESATEETSMDESESEDGTEDWDALLDSYEDFVDEYIALMKKAQQGDMSAVSEYGTYMEKAQELGDKMSKAQGQMSAAQWARYSKILQKMTKNMQ